MNNLTVPEGKALVLRCCWADMHSKNDFVWPRSGPVSCPDWDPKPKCGNGLHGWLWGEGDADVAEPAKSALEAVWLLVEVCEDSVVDLDGKVKFPKGDVVFCGGLKEAARLLAEIRGSSAPIIGHDKETGDWRTVRVGDCARVTVGDYGTALAGWCGTASSGVGGVSVSGRRGTSVSGGGGASTAGESGTALAGQNGFARAGYYGVAVAGDRGRAEVAAYGKAGAGDYGVAVAGRCGYAKAGKFGRAEVGYSGRARAGVGGTISFPTGPEAVTLVTFRVGEAGVRPDVAYRYTDSGQLYEAESESFTDFEEAPLGKADRS